MRRSFILVAAAVLAATCFACTAMMPPPASEAVAAVLPTPATCPDGSPFLSHVQMLDPSFVPNMGMTPTGLALSAPSPMTDDLSDAFRNSPPGFQQRLCGLDGIFICPNTGSAQCNFPNINGEVSGSWGYRGRGTHDLGKTYVALSQGLWPAGGHAVALHVYETWILQSFPGAGTATVSGATPDDPWMTVLAALAHEVGHVRFVQTVKANGSYDFTSLTNCATGVATAPFVDFFAGWAYQHGGSTHPHMQPFRGWRKFADRDNEPHQPLDHTNPPLLRGQLDLRPPASYPFLLQLYQANQPWASLFGAQTPDEDFVETYVMAVLTGYANNAGAASFAGPLTSLPLAIPGFTGPGQSTDVPRDLVAMNKPALANRMACISY